MRSVKEAQSVSVSVFGSLTGSVKGTVMRSVMRLIIRSVMRSVMELVIEFKYSLSKIQYLIFHTELPGQLKSQLVSKYTCLQK